MAAGVGRTLSDADLEILRALVREEGERLEARLSKQRPKGKRRLRAPAAAAELAAQVAPPVDDVAKARAARTLARIRTR